MKFAISVGEQYSKRATSQGIEEWYHCFLALINKPDFPATAGDIIAQLHFEPDAQYRIRGYLKDVFEKPHHFSCTKFIPILTGDCEHIKDLWNHMVTFAKKLETNDTDIYFGRNPRYDSESINCRTGVREALKSGGLTLYPEFTRCMAGMDAPNFFVGLQYNHFAPVSFP